MNSASSSGVFEDEKEVETRDYVNSPTHFNQWSTNDMKECNPDIEAAREARRGSSATDQQAIAENDEADNVIHPPPPDGGLLAWSQAIFAHLVSSTFSF